MSEKPVYLMGRGRGRGRGSEDTGKNWGGQGDRGRGRGHATVNNSMDKLVNNVNSIRTGKASKTTQEMSLNTESAQERFDEISSRMQESIQRHLVPNYQMDDSSEDEEDIADNVLQTVFKTYSSSFTNEEEDGSTVSKAQEYLLHSFRSGSSACLICIEIIKKEEAIWNCGGCAGMFHMQCIQKWVREGIYQQAYKSDDNKVSRDMPWFCPKCRAEYKQIECPTRYLCFCGKVEDPKFDPWLVPHSCGQTCGRRLKPDCGHECLLLCHPGPCAPCPKTVRAGCHCGKHTSVARCSAKNWACGQPCGRLLSCGQHTCQQPCHAGECAPCPKTSKQKCMCRKQVALQPCANPQWQCEQPCGKRLSCGNHVCEAECHAGPCGSCPRAGARSCPCGKTEFELPCTEDVPTCGDTCDQLLDCGIHTCSQMCHPGPCGTCRQMAVKQCRCGQKQKEVPCYKDYLCETKCTIIKDCKKHQCKRKCCDGNCPPCEQTCAKTLSCKNHKCASRCHRGPCYPCPLTVEITCFCKFTTITVPCGREKSTKPPRCHQKCKIPPDCHHPSRESHRCHFGDCPPCRQVCKQQLIPNCNHLCPMVCHTAVKIKIKDNVQRAGPWEGKPRVREEVIKKPCPPCQVPVPVSCLGNHESSNLPCSVANPYSCHRECGRQLPCGNHACSLHCHNVMAAVDNLTAGENCCLCESRCLKPRPAGCSHTCLLPCHQNACPPCNQMIRMRCHCQTVVRHVSCHEWNGASEEVQATLKSCGGQCSKNLPCGHQCSATCHPGVCPNADLCEKKVTVRCKCRRKKKDFICKDVQAGLGNLECDAMCEKEKEKKKQAEELARKQKEEEELQKQQAELEEFERKMGRKKRKPRKQRDVVEKKTFLQSYGKIIVISVSVAIIAVFLLHLLQIQ